MVAALDIAYQLPDQNGATDRDTVTATHYQEAEFFHAEDRHGEPEGRTMDAGIEWHDANTLALKDAHGQILAYIPIGNDPQLAQNRARLMAQAPRLLELVRFALNNIRQDRLQGLAGKELLNSYQRCCRDVIREAEGREETRRF